MNGAFPDLLFQTLHGALGYGTMNQSINYFPPLTQNSVNLIINILWGTVFEILATHLSAFEFLEGSSNNLKACKNTSCYMYFIGRHLAISNDQYSVWTEIQ